MGENEQATSKTCGDCAFWKTPKCSLSGDQAVLRKGDGACLEFYERAKGKEKPKKKMLKVSGVTAHGCFEAVYVGEKPCFLFKNSEDFRTVESLELNGETFCPKEANQVPYEPYGVYEGSILDREALFLRVRAEFETWVDVEPIWKDVLAACVMLTYHQEKLQTVPYVLLFGDNESGKSTVLQVLKFLCYRPMYGVTIPSADLYGYLEDTDGAGSILEDEIQGIHKDTDKIKIYKAGYKQGASVPRTLMTQFDRIIKYYRTFCFKACASEQIPQVKGFNERFLFIPMVEGYPQKEWADISSQDLERLRSLRNMLLKWRMQKREWTLPNVELSVKGRLKELWKPILQVTQGLAAYETLALFVDGQRTERLGLKQNTLEGHIVKVVVGLLCEQAEELKIPFRTIWTELGHDLDGKIDDKKPHVMDTSEFFQVTKNKVGYRLREVLSGQSKTEREKIEGVKDEECPRIKVYEFNREKLKRIAKKYGYDLVTKLPSAPSSEGVPTPESMDKNQLNNAEKGPPTPPELSVLSYLVTNPSKEPSTSQDLITRANAEDEEAKKLGLIPCQFCKALGNKFWATNDYDMREHVFDKHPEEYGTPEDYVR